MSDKNGFSSVPLQCCPYKTKVKNYIEPRYLKAKPTMHNFNMNKLKEIIKITPLSLRVSKGPGQLY